MRFSWAILARHEELAGSRMRGRGLERSRCLKDDAANFGLTELPGVASVNRSMRSIRSILVVLFVAASTGCSHGTQASVIAGADDLNVLRAILNPTCTSGSKQVVSDLPLAPFHELQSEQGGPIASFGSRLDASSPKEVRWPRGDICASVRVVDDALIKEVLSRETSIPPRWSFFRERFGDASKLLRVSIPTYSADGRAAVVYAEGTCPYSCGAGVVYELQDTGDAWTVVRRSDASRP